MQPEPITSPDDLALESLCSQLAQAVSGLNGPTTWPTRQLAWCAAYDVFTWFVPRSVGGQGWSERDLARGYRRLGKACLTTAFIITQRTAACVRLAESANTALCQRLLPDLVAGRSFATVAISHLTTSRRHLSRPVLAATEIPGGFRLDGYSPWVTGATQAQTIVTGAVLPDGQQILLAVPGNAAGVRPAPPYELVALGASQTGQVDFRGVELPHEALVAGPSEQVLKSSRGPGTGGLQTSTLALGLADAALDYLEREAGRRHELSAATAELRGQWQQTLEQLYATADGAAGCSPEHLRAQANSLALRTTQSALIAAKGTGFIAGHPVGRWCREALFFLVWSCPQGVLAANLCEWAGMEES